jgi:hypothetical protein
MSKVLKSDFWLTGKPMSTTEKAIGLQKYQKAIANYVNIISQKQVPVVFKGADSYTNGQRVVISADIENSEFDVAVGLALHEASHIKLTDFSLLSKKSFGQKMREHNPFYKDEYKKVIHTLINIIEDRRIDHSIYTESPGYRGYYKRLYDKYFNAEQINQVLEQKIQKFYEETLDNYLFHLTNMTNPKRDLNCLKGFKTIWDMIDLKNIDRLQNTTEVAFLAVDVLEEIFKNLDMDEDEFQQECEGQGEEKEGEFDPENMVPGDGSGEGTPLSQEQIDALKEALQNQKDFLDHNIEKGDIDSDVASAMQTLSDGGVDLEEIGNDDGQSGANSDPSNQGAEGGDDSQQKGNKKPYSQRIPKTLVTVVRNITPKLAQSGLIYGLSSHISSDNSEAIRKGIAAGKRLAHHLRARQETRTNTSTRQKNGKIDRRLISQLGYGNYEVFQTTTVEHSNIAHIHMSIDASGSMSGRKFTESLRTACAIAYASSTIQGVECVIDFRSDDGNGTPVVIIGYDSNRHKISQLKNLGYVRASSLTPEGLCFEAILDEIIVEKKGVDAYFVNFSDGEPYFGLKGMGGNGISYEDGTAVEHTKALINKMRQSGVKVLSYFIGNHKPMEFDQMYGSSSVQIDTNNIRKVANTLNKMLMPNAR